ncbi:MAG: TIGR04283 family arsenosugar biosynthesis glycosyltransferase [Acidobacteria bacterium]|nr:TIGR04283 family arsenosugar biosynthesis glycosyltransferase [Acidobacteriota bacterium]
MLERPAVSVVIPVLHDTAQLARALDTLVPDPRVEVIVVNGGEHDPSSSALEQLHPHVRWFGSSPGRGRQMNVGASHARGEWLLFLHADTRLPNGWLEELTTLAPAPAIVGGSFRFRLDSSHRWARVIERGVAARVRWVNLPYGDQALFVRREVFEALGGYREMPLMEDVEFVRRLARTGRLHHSRLPIVTSARRWETDGWIRRSLLNIMLLLLFLAGASPQWLARRYSKRVRRRRDQKPANAGR